MLIRNKKFIIKSIVMAAAILLTATCEKDVKVTGVRLNQREITMIYGETRNLTATVTPSNATEKTVYWHSEDPELVSANNGNITSITNQNHQLFYPGEERHIRIYVSTKDGFYSDECLVILRPPVITINTQPAAETYVTEGNISESLTVAASVTGNATLSYQWYRYTGYNWWNNEHVGEPVPGATSAIFSIPATLTSTGGGCNYYSCGIYDYFCEVKLGPYFVQSSVVTVSVTPKPIISIYEQPVETLVLSRGVSTPITVHAWADNAEVSYQWYSNTTNSNVGGTAILGETDYLFYPPPTNMASGSPYYYYCVVSATGGATPVHSRVTRVYVYQITQNPAPVTNVMAGSITGSLSVTVNDGGAALDYQWYFNTINSYEGRVAIPGATNANFPIPTTLTSGTYYYLCIVSPAGSEGGEGSSIATVNVTGSTITITAQPPETTNVTSGNISGNLSVAANVTGGETLSYQWYSNTTNSSNGGTIIPGATNTSFTIPTTLTAGTYYYFCEVRATGGATSVRSNVARVNVISITQQPAAITNVTEGNISAGLSVTADAGGVSLNYQWYSNASNSNTGGSAISGATSSTFSIPVTLTASGSPYYYYCVVSALGASSASSVATVNVTAPVITINTHPETITNVTAGSISGSLNVSASVSPYVALSYQWYSNTINSNTGGTAITFATNASFSIPTTLTASGSPYYYYCVVSATGATPVSSSVARVNVTENASAPVLAITTQPAATRNVTAGSISGSLSVTASVTSGSSTLSYQWYRNTTNSNTGGTVITGATSSSYTIPTTLTASGSPYYYFCEVRGTNGAIPVRSNVARVNVAYAFPTGVTLSRTNMTMLIGSRHTLTATVLPAAANQTVTWSSSDVSVATVNAITGEVTAVANGTAAITATTQDGSGQSICYVNVRATFTENFEGGSGTALSGWTFANSNTGGYPSRWAVGTATANGGIRACYIIGYNTSENFYFTNANTDISHFYYDLVVVSTAARPAVLSFDWKGMGDIGYDHLEVRVVDTSVTPAAGSMPVGTPVILGGSNTWQRREINLPEMNGFARIVFTWRNNNDGVGTQPPSAIDNVSITRP